MEKDEGACLLCGRLDAPWEFVVGWQQVGADPRMLNLRESLYHYACDYCVEHRADELRAIVKERHGTR